MSSLYAVPVGHPEAQSDVNRDLRVPSRVQFAYEFMQHVQRHITDRAAMDDDGICFAPSRELTSTEQSVYEQALRTMRCWMAEECDFADAVTPPAWVKTPTVPGSYTLVPEGRSVLAGAPAIVYRHEDELRVAVGKEHVPLSEINHGWWYGPLPMPPSQDVTLPAVSTPEKPKTKGET